MASRLTKQGILSKVASIFDQELWSKGFDWDDMVGSDVARRFNKWLKELKVIRLIQIPRCLEDPSDLKSTMVLTFVDGSNDAYGAVCYYRTVDLNGGIRVVFIASKTKVAPLTPISTPQMEMLAAILGLHVTSSIVSAVGQPMSQVIFWSDSMNVLYWIRGRGRQFRPFAANRVGQIQELTDMEQWRYISTTDNPADLCSRGISGSRFSPE